MLTDGQKMLIASALLSSALYLIACFVFALAKNNDFAAKMVIVSLGMCFISYVSQYLSGTSAVYEYVAKTATACSIVAGVAAGIAILWKP